MICAWVASCLLALFAVMLLFGGHLWMAVAPGLLTFFLLPPVRTPAKGITGLGLPPWLRIVVAILLAGAYFGFYFAGMASQKTIFLGKRAERKVMEHYDSGLEGWALGRAPAVKEGAWPWFLTVMRGTIGRPTAPRRLKAEELRSIGVPVLLILGNDDNLVGDPVSAAERAGNMPDLRVEVLDSGHLIAMERPREFNRLLGEFIDSRPEIRNPR